MIKRKGILVGAAVLISVVMVVIIVYSAVSSSRTSSAPTQEDVRSKSNASPNDALEKNTTAPETHSSTGATTPQPVKSPSVDTSPTPSKISPAAPSLKDKFSGTWVLDASRSEGLEPGMNQVMVVTRAGDIMTVKTTVSTPTKAAWTVTDVYTLNGQETEFTEQASVGASVKGQRIAKLTNGGNGIEVTERGAMGAPGASAKVNTTRKWMLDGDKSLVIEMSIEGDNFNRHHKRVFVRQ